MDSKKHQLDNKEEENETTKTNNKKAKNDDDEDEEKEEEENQMWFDGHDDETIFDILKEKYSSGDVAPSFALFLSNQPLAIRTLWENWQFIKNPSTTQCHNISFFKYEFFRHVQSSCDFESCSTSAGMEMAGGAIIAVYSDFFMEKEGKYTSFYEVPTSEIFRYRLIDDNNNNKTVVTSKTASSINKTAIKTAVKTPIIKNDCNAFKDELQKLKDEVAELKECEEMLNYFNKECEQFITVLLKNDPKSKLANKFLALKDKIVAYKNKIN